MSVQHTSGENAEYWAESARALIDERVHGKDADEVVAIAGDAVVLFGDGWSEDDVQALYDDMADHGLPVYATRGTRQIRIEGTDDRLSVPYADRGDGA